VEKFTWPQFDSWEENCVKGALKSCGQYIKILSFPHHVTPLKLAMLRDCANLVELRLPTSKLNYDQLGKAMQPMWNLQVLDVQWTGKIHLLLVICNRLKELTVIMEELDFTEVLTEWATKEFIPNTLSIISTKYFRTVDIRQLWLSLNADSSIDHTSCFKVYGRYKVPMNLSTSMPDFQLQFGQPCTLPFVRASMYGLLGFDVDLLLLTSSTHAYGANTSHKATMVYKDRYGFDTIIQRNDLNNNIDNLAFISHFDASHSYLQSGHLEQLAMACHNLLELNLKHNIDCLKSLKGVRAITACCHNLRGLNLLFISAKYVESQVQLWEILVKMKLTYLAIDASVLLPYEIDEQTMSSLSSLYQKCVDLKALEFDSEQVDKVGGGLLLSEFPSLVHLFARTNSSTAMTDILYGCTQLKFLIYSSDRFDSFCLPAPNCNLEQLYVDTIDISKTFMEAISAHGGLEHVVMEVRSVTGDGVAALIENSPKLITCQINAKHFNTSVAGVKLDLKDFKKTLEKKFYNRKLFSCGSYNFSRQCLTPFMMICNNSELTSMWSRDSCHRNFRLTV